MPTDNWVTQDEAFAITRLLASLERSPRDGMPIEELAELLQVSVEEARVLTSLVRHQAPGSRSPARKRGKLRHWVIGGFTVYAAIEAACLLGKLTKLQGSSSEGLLFIVLSAWTIGAVWYYRKPILRAIHRFLQGHDSSLAQDGSRQVA